MGTNDLSECMIECNGNYSCGLSSIDGLMSVLVETRCNEMNSCNNLVFDCTDSDITMDPQCNVICNETESCLDAEIRGQNAMNMNVKCHQSLSCSSVYITCPDIVQSECLIECGTDHYDDAQRQCYNSDIHGSESWNFTTIINGNRSCENCIIRGESNMNYDLNENSIQSDNEELIYYNGTESSFYWMNIIVNGVYGYF